MLIGFDGKGSHQPSNEVAVRSLPPSLLGSTLMRSIEQRHAGLHAHVEKLRLHVLGVDTLINGQACGDILHENIVWTKELHSFHKHQKLVVSAQTRSIQMQRHCHLAIQMHKSQLHRANGQACTTKPVICCRFWLGTLADVNGPEYKLHEREEHMRHAWCTDKH